MTAYELNLQKRTRQDVFSVDEVPLTSATVDEQISNTNWRTSHYKRMLVMESNVLLEI